MTLSSPGMVEVALLTPFRVVLAGLAVATVAVPAAVCAQDPAPFPTTTFAEGATSASIGSGAVTATITMVGDGRSAVPVLTVTTDGVAVLEVAGVGSGYDFPTTEATIAEIDPGNDTPEVVFTSYSGGAHCCTTVIVAEALGEAWVAVPVGDFDGGGDYLHDLDGDGLAESGVVDNRFLYQFDCYACSAAPLTVLTVRDGNLVDVSTARRYFNAHAEWLAELEAAVDPAERWSARGFLAGWLGAKVRVGEGAAAWAELIDHWDYASDPGESTCVTGGEPENCAAADLKMYAFPQRVRLFLETNGYRF